MQVDIFPPLDFITGGSIMAVLGTGSFHGKVIVSGTVFSLVVSRS